MLVCAGCRVCLGRSECECTATYSHNDINKHDDARKGRMIMTQYCDECTDFGHCEYCGVTCKHWPCSCDMHQERNQSALQTQVGGDHYKSRKIQPVEYCMANGIGFMEGSVIKYVTRWRDKGGVQDLKKARHFLDLLIEYEEGPH